MPERTSVSFFPIGSDSGSPELRLLVRGEPETVDEARAKQILKNEDLEIRVDLGGGEGGAGKEAADYWFCDFSKGMYTVLDLYRLIMACISFVSSFLPQFACISSSQ